MSRATWVVRAVMMGEGGNQISQSILPAEASIGPDARRLNAMVDCEYLAMRTMSDADQYLGDEPF